MGIKHTFPKVVLLFFLLFFHSDAKVNKQEIVNDVTQLNPIQVAKIITPTQNQEISSAIKNSKGPVSIGGGRFSMGGQTATENALQIDVRKFNRILSFSKSKKEITVQAGIRWREVIEYIDRQNLSVKIMQTYANFTVGGSLSVNVHGRYVGQGPIILAVKSIKLILANGELVEASPTVNRELFYTAIGGYGGIGVITEVTLSLTDNCKVERRDTVMKVEEYQKYFAAKIRNNPAVIFHNADFYPTSYKKVRAVSYVKTTKKVTIKERLKPIEKSHGVDRFAMKVVSGSSFGKWIRQHIFDPIHYLGHPVEWRNYEATYDLMELEPANRNKTTYVLQEYFVPKEKFNSFYPKMVKILKDNDVNVINISIRQSKQDPGSIMAWAKTEVFAFVIYYKQDVSAAEKLKVKKWTQQLVNASISEKGTYYLPYQIHATKDQFLKAYPNFKVYAAIKKKYDPNYKFRNKLFDAYY